MGAVMPIRLRNRRSILLVFFCMVALSSLVLLEIQPTFAQKTVLQPEATAPAPRIDPRFFGLNIPQGEIRPGGNKRVVTTDEAGKAIVALLHARVGKNGIVMLPDGKLVSRTPAEASATQRPFVPLSHDETARALQLDKQLARLTLRETKHYVFLYNTSPEFADMTRRILETLLPGVMGYLKNMTLEVHEPILPLVVIMFRTRQEYQNFQRMPAGVVAYYNTVSNHVVMTEETSIEKLKQELGLQQSISTIAHEGVHQILHNVGVQQRLSVWPMWASEGFAEYLSPTSFGKRMRWKGAGKVNDLRMFEIERYRKGRPAGTEAGQLVEHTVGAARLSSTGYATAWALTYHLARAQKKSYATYIRNLSEIGPLQGSIQSDKASMIAENKRLFARHFGSDFAKIEASVLKRLDYLPYNDPFSEWPHFVTLLNYGKRGNERQADVFHTYRMAVKWGENQIQKLPKDKQVAAQYDVVPFPDRRRAQIYLKRWLRRRVK